MPQYDNALSNVGSGAPLAERYVPRAQNAATESRHERFWRIREVDTRTVPGAKADRCLICESAEDGLVRRVWNYPPHWGDLSDRELQQLCDDQ